MIGADPKRDRVNVTRGASRCAAAGRTRGRALRSALLALLLPVAAMLAACGKAPNPAALAANAHPADSDSFDDRFPKPQFRDRFPSEREALRTHAPSDFAPPRRTVQTVPVVAPASVRLAALAPQLPAYRERPQRDELTTLVSMKNSAFPYFGNNPASDAPFLNISKGERRGHRSYSGRVFWQDETYNDSRVLMHVPEHFDARKPGVIVVFFHGNGATLERDVRDRQALPRQISESGVNAVLLAPQMAVNAADSSAGKFWQPGHFRRFIAEATDHLARMNGDPAAAKSLAGMPIIIVGYSGGFLPTAYSLEVGGLNNRIKGVVLLDAVYGQLDKFANFIASNRSAFFISSYTRYTARHDRELMQMIREKGIRVAEEMDGPLKPGSVVFVETGDGITHRDYVTQAWTRNPVKDVLVRMADGQNVMRVAANASSPSNR